MLTTRTETLTDLLVQARAAYRAGDWHAAYTAFSRAGAIGPLPVDDLDAMATAAWRVGHGREAVRVAELVFIRLIRTDPNSAAMKAVEISRAWLSRGDLNIGRSWMGRARGLLGGAADGAALGYLTYLDTVVAVRTDDVDVLAERSAALRELSTRVEVPALTALSLAAQAMSAIFGARTAEAYGLLDEAMPLLGEHVPLEWAGDVYGLVLHHGRRLADPAPLRAWTASMQQWCDVTNTATYGGVCDVHRLQRHDDGVDRRLGEDRLLAASRALEEVNSWVAGEGYYRLGEVRRRRGDVDGALAAFVKARSLGVEPQPGEALLRCGRGEDELAWTQLRAALAGADRLSRIRMLHGAVEIALARDDLEEAQRYCRDLDAAAATYRTPGFAAWAAHARGALLVRRGDHAEALTALQSALEEYRAQQSSYEMAEVYEWMAPAHRGLGADADAAADEAAAADIYRRLGSR